jgi:hypothetical protein
MKTAWQVLATRILRFTELSLGVEFLDRRKRKVKRKKRKKENLSEKYP